MSHVGHFHPDMLRSLDRLVAASIKGGVDIHICKTFGSLIAGNRNSIAKEAIQRNDDYLLFIDSDMVFDGDFLLDLLKRKRDIVSGLCVSRRPPYRPVAKVLHPDGRYFPRNGLDEGRFFSDLDAVGTAFVLIKTDVFRKIEPPWFAMPPYMGGIMGEDVYFCKKAKEVGYDVCVDTSIIVGHVGEHAFTIYDHLDYMKEHAKEVDLAFD